VALVRSDVSEECIASIIRIERIREVGTMLGVASVLTRSTHRHNSEDGILNSTVFHLPIPTLLLSILGLIFCLEDESTVGSHET
jgi:hypothetical protein